MRKAFQLKSSLSRDKMCQVQVIDFCVLASQDWSGAVDEWLKYPIFEGHLFGLKNFFGYDIRPFLLNGWKIIGFGGMFLFTSRWFVQMWASKQKREVTMPRAFWYLSILGSLMLLLYFFGYQKDSVGVMANLFPLGVASYNLYLDLTRGRERRMRPRAKGSQEREASENSAKTERKSSESK